MTGREKVESREARKAMKHSFLKTAVTALSVLSLTVAAAACGASSTASENEPILIGQVAGTTGAYGTVGQAMVNAADMAVKDVNAKGGVLGRKLALKWFNDQASATLAVQHFDRLVSEGAVAIAGSNGAGPATASQAQRRQIPAVGVVNGGGLTIYPEGPGTTPNPWTFTTALNTFAWGTKIAEYALEHCKGLAVLHDSTTYGMGGAMAIKAAYKAAGKTLALDESITENWSTGATVGLTAEINKIKASGADCVDVWLTPQDQAAFVQTARDLGAELTFLGNDTSNFDTTFTSLAKDQADGFVSAELTTRVQPNEQLKAFQERYKQAYGTESTPFAEATYDGIMMLAQVIQTTKSTDPKELQKGLNAITGYQGLTGNLSFTPQKHTTIEAEQLTAVVYDAKSQQWKPVS
jgi:ABC-type branched-subunit amino acid transport system substrate-binding protein